jgi:Nucleotidyl transferase AbiEii toxin, Type IV TA system
MRYKTALDFRRALTHRHNEQARKTGTGVNDLHKRVAFERFLARLFQTGDERWVLKGGYALELRLGGKARATVDIDLNVPPPPEDDLLEVLRTAADHDLGDFFRFAITPSPQPLKGPPMGGSRFMVDAILADKTFVKFAIDVGQGDVLLNPVEWLDGQVNLEFAGLPAVKFPSYPLVHQASSASDPNQGFDRHGFDPRFGPRAGCWVGRGDSGKHRPNRHASVAGGVARAAGRLG